LLLCDVGVALSAGPKRRSCCWSWVLIRKVLLCAETAYGWSCWSGWGTQPLLEKMMNVGQKTNGEACWQGWILRVVSGLEVFDSDGEREPWGTGVLSAAWCVGEKEIRVSFGNKEEKQNVYGTILKMGGRQ
jgi:hypothetical protein